MSIVIDYTSRDFQSLFNDLKNAIPDLLPEWTSRDPSDMGIVLLELFSYEGDILNYYIDRVMNEAFLPTAQRRQSVLDVAQLLNYTPVAMRPATVLLSFVTTGPTVTIPALTQVATVPIGSEAPIIFETDTALTVPGNDSATPVFHGTVSATQGTTQSLENVGISDGTIAQTFSLYFPNVVQASVQVFVDEGFGPVLWTFHANLIDAGASERAYSLSIDENNVTSVNFGDNVNGRIPTKNAQVQVTYRNGNGFDGNVQAGLLTQLVQTVTGVVSVINNGAATGGVDIESTDSMRSSIPNSFKALQRAVTLADYAALAIQVPGVVKANASAALYTSVTVYVAPSGGGVPSADLQTTAQTYLQDRSLIGTSVTIGTPVYVDVNITATVHISDAFSQQAVMLDAESALTQALAFTALDFAQTIPVSQIYSTLQAVEGVVYVTLTLVARGDAAQSGVTDAAMAVDEIGQLGALTLNMVGGIS